MRTFVLVFTLTFFSILNAHSQTPSLGNYPATTVATASNNTFVYPSIAPANAISTVAYTSTNFKGILQVNSTTGIITVTNAYPAGVYTVTVKAFNSSLVATSTFTLTVNNSNCSQGFFAGNTEVPMQSIFPQNIIVADFNNDGKQDFAVTHYRNSGSVSVRLGDGAGGFTNAPSISVYDYPVAVSTGDFNGDGKQDLAILSDYQYRSYVSIRLGNGAGGFTSTPDVQVSNSARAMVVGDFNNDGKQDLAVSNGNVVSIRLGNGLGAFSGTNEISITNGGVSIALGDFNNDGKQDFATANSVNPGTVCIRLGDGAGNFTTAPLVNVGNYPKAIIVDDFNRDGQQDIATANYAAGSVSVRLGDGAGGFIQSSDIVLSPSQYTIFSLAAGDFNGDGNPDIGVNNANVISVLLGNGTGTFYNNTAVPVATGAQTIAIGDFNNDGRQDLLAAGSNTVSAVSVRLGKAGTSIINVSGNNIPINNTDNTPSQSDFTNFGTTNSGMARTFAIQNTGTDTLIVNNIRVSGSDAQLFTITGINLPVKVPTGGSINFSVGFTPTSTGLKTAIINISNDDCSKNLFYYTVQATGLFVVPTLPAYPVNNTVITGGNIIITPSSSLFNTQTITASSSANFKGTLLVNPSTGVVSVTNASPAGRYTINLKSFNGSASTTTSFQLNVNNSGVCSNLENTNSIAFGVNAGTITLGDFNNDGKQDFITTLASNNAVAIRLGNGTGNFTGNSSTAVGTNPSSLAVGDFDGDGKLDFVTTINGYNQGSVSVRLGDGNGGFTGSTSVLVGLYPIITVADFNNDGKLDFATCNRESNSVSVRMGDGAGNFSGTLELTTGVSPRSITVADFNGDDNVDIIVGNYNDGTASIYLGNGAGGFSNAQVVTVDSGVNSIGLGDFNSDGKLDFATANLPRNTVSIRYGNGLGAFTGTNNMAVETNPLSIAVADFNGDGKPDFATTNSNNNLSVRYNDGAGNFTSIAKIIAASQALTIGDFNSDGKPDILASNVNISVCLGSSNDIIVKGNEIIINDGSTTPGASDSTYFGTASNTTITYNIKNTGPANLTVSKITLSGADSASFTVSNITYPVVISRDSTFAFSITFSPLTTGIKNARVNITNDNCSKTVYDFAVQGLSVAPTIGSYTAPVTLITGGNISINPSVAPTNAYHITATTSPAFKGLLVVDSVTGKLIITNAFPAGTYTVTVNGFNGALTQTNSFTLSVGSAACSQGLLAHQGHVNANGNNSFIAIGDFNNDNKQDLSVTNNNGLSVFLGDGIGSFGTNTITGSAFNVRTQVTEDVNGDGKLDIIAINNAAANYVLILLGDGVGHFTKFTDVPLPFTLDKVIICDFNSDGKPDLAAVGGYKVFIRLGDGLGNFSGTGLYDITCSIDLSAADFNNDGKVDLAVAQNFRTFNTINSVTLLLGNGQGSFTTGVTMPVAIGPDVIKTADFNRDGNQDFATLSQFSNNISVCLGNGAGGFAPYKAISTFPVSAYPNPSDFDLGDFNGDEIIDFAITNFYEKSFVTAVGDGTGNFASSSTSRPRSFPTNLAVGDFNQDGLQDVVVSYIDTSSAVSFDTLSIYLGGKSKLEIKGNNQLITNNDNTPDFSDSTDFGNATNLTLRNFSVLNTGNNRIIVSKVLFSGSDSLSFLLRDIPLPITFYPGVAVNIKIGFLPTSPGLKIAALKLIGNSCDEPIYSFSVQGTGATGPPSLGNYPATTLITSGKNGVVVPSAGPIYAANLIATASSDFKGVFQVEQATGKIIITNAYPAGVYTVIVKSGSASVSSSFTLTVGNTTCGKGIFGAVTNGIPTVGTNADAIAVADFNGDGKQDIATANSGSNNVTIGFGDGLGGFYGVKNIPVGTSPSGIVIADFNADGKQDIIVANYGSGTVSICYGNLENTFSTVSNISVGANPNSIAIADFNRDGKLDFAAGRDNVNKVIIRLGNGMGSFTAAADVTVGYYADHVITSDFNGDSIPDLAVGNSGEIFVSICLGDGTGAFTNAPNVPVNGSILNITNADFNNDGLADLAVSNINKVSIYLGNGNGTFTNLPALPFAYGVNELATGDFNGDGNIDMVLATGSIYMYLRLGNGAGGFTPAPSDIVLSGIYPRAVAVGDFNNDGRQDFVFPNYSNVYVGTRLGSNSGIKVITSNGFINNGTTNPTIADFTDYGVVNVGSSASHSFNIYNAGGVNLVIKNIRITGIDSAMFIKSAPAFPITLGSASSMTFSIAFTPTSVELKNAWINIDNDNCADSLFRFAVKGGPEPAAALHFDGINDYISVNDTIGNIGGANATIAAWVKTASSSATTIISKGNSCSSGSYFNFSITASGHLSVDFNENGTDRQLLTGKAAINNNVWHHVVVVRRQDTMFLYVDGLIDTASIYTNTPTISNISPMLIGATTCNVINSFFNGNMDEVQLYNRALSTSEIQSHVNCEISGQQNGLLAYYRFNQGFVAQDNTSINTLTDSSGHGNVGQLNSFTLTGNTSNWVGQGPVISGFQCTGRSTWLGITSSWNDPNNWSSGFIPSETTRVVINTGVQFMPEISSPYGICYSLTISNGAIVRVVNNGHLHIIGN